MKSSENYLAWLKKAKNDLASAKILLDASDNELLHVVTNLSQQAAEKALKTYLVFMGINFAKTHDIEVLLELCIEQNPDFEKIPTGRLNDYGVRARYPDDDVDPDFAESNEAVSTAERIYRFVESMITEKENLSLF